MRPKKIVYILGAGASRPYLFPTGGELRTILLHQPNDEFTFLHQTTHSNRLGRWSVTRAQRALDVWETPELFERFREEFNGSEVYSIDRFLFENPQHAEGAKNLMSLVLLGCEANISSLRGNWYQRFWNDTVIPAVQERSEPIDIITFNYDRSLEHYMSRSMAYYFGRNPDALRHAKEQLRYHHVYGSLGPLEGAGQIPYGSISDSLSASKNINLIQPRTTMKKDLMTIIGSADVAMFLGFGFDDLNISALGIDKTCRPREVFATRMGLSKTTQVRATQRIGRIHFGGEDENVDRFLSLTLAYA